MRIELIIKKIKRRLSVYTEKLFIKINSFFAEKGVILMYHHVNNDDIEPNPSCICSVDEFKMGLQCYIDNGYKFIRMEDLLSNLKVDDNKFAIVTFDDGYKDVITNAYPFLKQNSIPFIIYLVTDFVDKPGYLNMDDINTLLKEGLCTLGFHTKSHQALSSVKNYNEELRQGRALLEQKLGREIDYFAYPYGKPDMVGFKGVCKISKMDYMNAVGTISCPVTNFSALFKYYLPRIVVSKK